MFRYRQSSETAGGVKLMAMIFDTDSRMSRSCRHLSCQEIERETKKENY